MEPVFLIPQAAGDLQESSDLPIDRFMAGRRCKDNPDQTRDEEMVL